MKSDVCTSLDPSRTSNDLMLSQTDFGALGSGLVCALGGSGIMPRKCEMFY